ncbi:uncharacterized protein K452DRAFT_303955 [Aplosporella prunicola CBS 121167]|uniref:Uncharacterized protein n=1 Tax=Aplosporella prunicola CBS 121167 TaxID=1176127 RepID=A0A6A6BUN0_9PEZI|nr:uncharacterized protein K452DRAFT_303955 [Aplosporella prunicola CBS 121167]KAF2147053.1 hypothetical protein K452DRAFT_303955 [Aplosporella prunicola CBS 121167]
MSDTAYARIELQPLASVQQSEGYENRKPTGTDGTRASSLSGRHQGSSFTANPVIFRSVSQTRTVLRDAYAKSMPFLRESYTESKPFVRQATYHVKSTVTQRWFIRHIVGLLTLLLFGLLPCILYFRILENPFSVQEATCDGYRPKSDNDNGIQGLFTIDRVSGAFPFWLAKLLDTIWDLAVGRGFQFVSSCVAYVVFTSAVLRTIEVSPIPYRTFISLSQDGPTVSSIVSLLADITRYARTRTTLLFVWVTLSTLYVVAMPTLFSTMTGYISTSRAFTQIPSSTGSGLQYIPRDDFFLGLVIHDLPGIANNTCFPTEEVDTPVHQMFEQSSQCYVNRRQCKAKTLESDGYNDYLPWVYFSNETYLLYGDYYNCNATLNMTVAGKTLAWKDGRHHIGDHAGWCYDGKPYGDRYMYEKTQCMPDTKGARYHWGFSATLTSVVVIVHAVWALTMYAVWLEAEVHGRLLREGYNLTQLRGIFVVAAAAQDTTGMEVAELKTLSTSKVEKELFDKGARVEFKQLEKELPYAHVTAFEAT